MASGNPRRSGPALLILLACTCGAKRACRRAPPARPWTPATCCCAHPAHPPLPTPPRRPLGRRRRSAQPGQRPRLPGPGRASCGAGGSAVDRPRAARRRFLRLAAGRPEPALQRGHRAGVDAQPHGDRRRLQPGRPGQRGPGRQRGGRAGGRVGGWVGGWVATEVKQPAHDPNTAAACAPPAAGACRACPAGVARIRSPCMRAPPPTQAPCPCPAAGAASRLPKAAARPAPPASRQV
jgi:hypothetical protein